MLNLLRADMYRVLRGKGIYITFIVLLIVNIFVSGVFQAAQSGAIEFGSEEATAAIVAELGDSGMTGAEMPALLSSSMDNVIWFMLAVIMIVAAVIFSDKTVKNDISFGVCRIKLYLSKLILCAVFCFIIMAFYIASGVLIGTVLSGFGGPLPSGYWSNLVQVFFAQYFMMLGVTSVGVFLVFTLKSYGAALGSYFAFFLIPMVIVQLLVFARPSLEWLANYDLPSSLNLLANIQNMETGAIVRAFSIGGFYLVVVTILGIVLFRRAEIK